MKPDLDGQPSNDPHGRLSNHIRIVDEIKSWIRRPLGGLSDLEGMRYLSKWLPLSFAVGVVAGIGAIVFYLTIDLVTRVMLGDLVGYLPPSPAGEGGSAIPSLIHMIHRPWLLPLVVAAGGLLSGVIVFSLAPEAEGHGTDAAIAAIHHKQGRMRGRVPLIKLVASAITIGTGGSAGREGPAAQISAGFGSMLGGCLRLSPQDRRILVAAGIGAGIGAIFRAPLGGAVLAAEILYLHDLEVEALLPALIASIVGYTIYGSLFGFTPIFGSQPDLALTSPIQLLYYAILGMVCGLVGILYARVFYGVSDIFKLLSLPNWLKPAVGGLVVGLMGIRLPQVLHMGYGWLQIAMTPSLRSIPLWLILLLPFAKILSTSLSIGSGGSGGIFAPGMFIGGMVGAGLWRLGVMFLPHMPITPAPFVIVGMMALFGGVAHAPLAVMLMVAEMTGNLSLLAPAMIAVAVSYSVVGDVTIYSSQLPNRASSPTHRIQMSFPLLSSLVVSDAVSGVPPLVGPSEQVRDVRMHLRSCDYIGVCVVDGSRYLGAVSRDRLEALGDAQGDLRMESLVDPDILPVSPNAPLDQAMEQLAAQPLGWAPVVSAEGVVGQVTVRDAIRAYRRFLERGVRRATDLPPGTMLLEAKISASSPLANKRLREVSLPAGSLVISINRSGDVVFPRGDTRLEPGDLVVVTTTYASEKELRSLLAGK